MLYFTQRHPNESYFMPRTEFDEHLEFAKKLELNIQASVFEANRIRQTWIDNAKEELLWLLLLREKNQKTAFEQQPLPLNTAIKPEEAKKEIIEDLLSQLEFIAENLKNETLKKFDTTKYTNPDGSPDTDIEGDNKPHIRDVIEQTFQLKPALSLAVQLEDTFKNSDKAALAASIALFQRNASVSMHDRISVLAHKLNAATSQKEINQLSIELSGLIRFAQESHKKACEILKLDPKKTSPEQISAAALRKIAEEKRQASDLANKQADATQAAAQQATADAAAANEQLTNTQLAIDALSENMSSQSGTDLQESQTQLDALKEQFTQENSTVETLKDTAEKHNIIAGTAKTAAVDALVESTDASKSADLIDSFDKGANKIFDTLVNPTIQNVAKDMAGKIEDFCGGLKETMISLKSTATKAVEEMAPEAKTALEETSTALPTPKPS